VPLHVDSIRPRLRRWRDALITGVLAVAVVFLVCLGPYLLTARAQPGVDTFPVVSGIPVGWHGIYFFTVIAVALAFLAALGRGAHAVDSGILAVAGLGFFELVYGVAFASTTGRAALLIPSPGLPTTGWAGLGTWVLAELAVATFALVSADRLGIDRPLVLAGAAFLGGLVLWDLGLGWAYPPYDNSLEVYLVNTWTEVWGTVLLPIAFTADARGSAGYLDRIAARASRFLLRTRRNPSGGI
jgi:hypothetical protein